MSNIIITFASDLTLITCTGYFFLCYTKVVTTEIDYPQVLR